MNVNAVTKQQLMEKVINAIERDSRSSQTANTSQLKQESKRLENQVREFERTFQRVTQAEKTYR